MTSENASPPDDVHFRDQIGKLEDLAGGLLHSKRFEEAERIYAEIARVAPGHLPALQYLGSRALARGDLAVAQDLFERAIRLAPLSAMTHQHLGIVLRARGYPEGALKAFDIARRQSPEQAILWVQCADMLRTLDRRDEAVAMYQQAEYLWGDLLTRALGYEEDSNPRRQLLGAAHYLAKARMQAIDKALVHNGKPLAVSSRIHAALQHMSRAVPPRYAEPLQRPGYAYVPDLGAKPFFERREAPYLAALERESDAIRSELQAVLAEPDSLSPYIEGSATGLDASMIPLRGSSKWSSYHLYRAGEIVAEHAARCPRTMAAIEQLQLARLDGHAPSVLFSLLEPGAHIPPHNGLANYKLVTHLPLILPPHCAIRVGDETRSWTPGKCLIFDDTFEHEAWNRSDRLRVVLIFEIWNPGLDATEREVLARAQSALARSRRKMAGLIQRSLAN